MPRSRITLQEIKRRKPTGSRITPICIYKRKINSRGSIVTKIKVVCDCGKMSAVWLNNYLSGSTKSCGCLFLECDKNKKYHPYVKEIYGAYANMIQRCYNPACHHYKSYGKKGVVVCEEWLNNYQSFLDWSLKNGWAKNLQLDKDIKGNGKLYSPQSCLWVTAIENMSHKKIKNEKK